MNVAKVVLPALVLVSLSVPATPVEAGQRAARGDRGRGQAVARSAPRQGPARPASAPRVAPRAGVARSQAIARSAPRQGPTRPAPAPRVAPSGPDRRGSVFAPGRVAVPRAAAPYRSYNGRYYGRPYSSYGTRAYPYRYSRPFYYSRPVYYARPYYVFRPRVSLGFGFWAGYSVPYFHFGIDYGYPYPYAPYPYPYTYPYPYPYGYAPPYGYSSPYAASGYAAPAPGTSVNVSPEAAAYGGVSFEITPSDAGVYVDGVYAGTVGDFTPNSAPLALDPGTHRIEVRSPGYEPMGFDVEVTAGQVIPYRGALQPVR